MRKAGYAKKLVDGKNIEVSVPTSRLKLMTRKQVAREYYTWVIKLEKAKTEFFAVTGIGFAVFWLGFFFDPIILLALLPLAPIAMKAQFKWGDILDDKETWAGKHVVRMDL